MCWQTYNIQESHFKTSGFRKTNYLTRIFSAHAFTTNRHVQCESSAEHGGSSLGLSVTFKISFCGEHVPYNSANCSWFGIALDWTSTWGRQHCWSTWFISCPLVWFWEAFWRGGRPFASNLFEFEFATLILGNYTKISSKYSVPQLSVYVKPISCLTRYQ